MKLSQPLKTFQLLQSCSICGDTNNIGRQGQLLDLGQTYRHIDIMQNEDTTHALGISKLAATGSSSQPPCLAFSIILLELLGAAALAELALTLPL